MSAEGVRGSLSFSRFDDLPLLRVLAVNFQTSLSAKGYSFRDEKSLGLDGEGKRPVARGQGEEEGWRLRESLSVSGNQ